MNSKDEEDYWREHHHKQPFVKPGHTYEHYAPAYRTGYEGCDKHPGRKFEEIEPDLASDYEKHGSVIAWDDARDAARAAWDKVSGVIAPRDVSRGVRYD
ncbi:MAG TPA: hypothetical protein VII34_05610 [Pyrinomonadaceae bacterium]